MSVPFAPSERTARPTDEVREEPRVTLEMGGPNVVIRSSPAIDREYTNSLAHAVNAAAMTHTVVVLDPDPIRCDDSFAGARLPASETDCSRHADCRPVDVEVVGSGLIRIAAETCWWLIDVAHGRFCRVEGRVDPRFIVAESWTRVVAICITPTRLRALTADGSLVSSARAHDPPDDQPIALVG